MADEEKDPVQMIADAVGGTVQERFVLPDGSGAAMVSFPLPKNHWLTRAGRNVPPMPFLCGTGDRFFFQTSPQGGARAEVEQVIDRDAFARAIRAAGKYALRCSTMNGTEDQDPDALLQNLVVGMLGYWTETGLGDSNENPVMPFDFEAEK